ncbi:MAG: STAS domain-containing protein [Eubacterium sp.]|nr:STAS domain-containing protein [Eubacterium sp.]
MELNHILKDIEITPELLERTNPVFQTAKFTLYQLAASGDLYAGKIVKILGLTDETQGAKGAEKIRPEMLICNFLMMETRFRGMMQYALDMGVKNFVDLPCGYTPRSLMMSEQGIHFTGCDLPAVVEEFSSVIDKIASPEQKKYIRYCSVDATNYQSLRKAFEGIDGEVCISTEGLMMYLTDSETEVLCSNIAALLKEFGGCWITPDPETSIGFFGYLGVMFGEKAMEIMMKSKNVVAKQSDVEIGKSCFVGGTPEAFANAVKILAKYGLKMERVPFAGHTPELRSYEKLTPEQVAGSKKVLEKMAIWVITYDENTKAEEVGTIGGEAFSLSALLEGESLNIKLKGRMDSISAPDVLAFYDKTEQSHTFTDIVIDCSELAYISSAGLRVLLSMAKKHPNHVKVTDINETVKDIIEQTGFDSIVNVE